MLDLSRFSDILSQFGAGAPSRGLLAQSKTAELAPVKVPEPERLRDGFSFSPVQSNNAGSTFDRQDPSKIAVNSDGIYRPTQIQHQFNSSLNFSFSASLSRATVVQRSQTPGGLITQEREASQFSYQSQALSERQQVGNSVSEVRRFQTDMFFSRTRTLSQSLSPETGEKLESTGRQVARRFEIEISLDISFLSQFGSQTEGLAEDEDLLGQYLDNAGGLAERSGEALQAFFDEVDQILADTESYVKDSLGSFLADAKAAFGLSGSEADDFTNMVVEEVTAFFEDVDSFLSESRQAMLASQAPEPALPEGNVVEEAAVLV